MRESSARRTTSCIAFARTEVNLETTAVYFFDVGDDPGRVFPRAVIGQRQRES